MIITVCILAKNEAETIGTMLSQISRQSLLKRTRTCVHVHVLANGCTDATAAAARECDALFEDSSARLIVHEIEQGGKSRTWNKAVHMLTDASTKTFVFIDPDVELLSSTAIEDLLIGLESNPSVPAYGGYPVKDVQAKQSKTLIDKFSLAMSAKAKPSGVINGSLYAIRAEVAREIWLPNDIPGEDGFLNAMVTTRGFTTQPGQHVVKTLAQPTHSFKAHTAKDFLTHERRMIVGTAINIWIFEFLWSLKLEIPAGELIRQWNENDPDWVESIIRKRAHGKLWTIPNGVIFGRLSKTDRSWLRTIAHLPLATLATVLTVPPSIAANAILKQRGAAAFW